MHPTRPTRSQLGWVLTGALLATACSSAAAPATSTPPTAKIDVTMSDVPPVLTSIWARAPYGHAGQWPNLQTTL